MKKISYLLLGIALLGCEEKKTSTPAATTATATAVVTGAGTAQPSGTAATPDPPKATGNKDIKETVSQLPALDESFHAAREMGLLEAWQKAAPFKPRKLSGLKPGELAIEVGKVLVDAAVMTADTKKPVSPEAIQQVVDAVKALNPPAPMLEPVQALGAEVKKGGLKDEELRMKLGKLIVETLPAVEEDPKLASSAGLAMVGGYLRSLAITSKVLAGGAGSDQDKLDLLHRKQENAHFIDLVVKKVDPSVQGEPAVRDALDALQKIKPHVEKAKPTMDDAKAVSTALAKYAS